MVLTPSTMLELGTEAPAFSLLDVKTNKYVLLDQFRGKQGLLVMFICAHCPYVKHVEQELGKIGRDYIEKNIGIVAISSNDINTHPDDSPDKLKAQAEKNDFTFPYCFDEGQLVAKAYRAACTPDFFLFDADMELVYRGQLDGSRPGSETPVTGNDLRAALDTLLANAGPIKNQKPAMGCNIKWTPGQEPAWFGAQ